MYQIFIIFNNIKDIIMSINVNLKNKRLNNVLIKLNLILYKINPWC